MAVFELKTEVPLDAAPALEELLAEREEQRLMMLEDKPSGRAWLTGYFESRTEATVAWQDLAGATDAPWTKAEPVVRELPDEDWKNSYKAHFKAWKFGRLNWVPVWERETFVLPAGEEVLWLDPGMAFGTGNHETTRLCCERLALFAAAHGNSARVIDAGCGSGILALSAAKLGFGPIAGFDNDAEAIRVSEENAALNGLAGRVEFYVGDLVTGFAGGRTAGLVLANIQADVLMRFEKELCAAVAPGGQLVLSGILGQELETVQAKFAATAVGWRVESRVLGEWADLSLTRPA
jgi:ribosomal protein L11 methyltransferase